MQIMIERFKEVCKELIAELMWLWQKGNVTDYHSEFDVIVSRLDLSDTHQLSCFLGGLQTKLQMVVQMLHSTFVMKALSLAKMYKNDNSMNVKPFSKSLKLHFVAKPPLLPTLLTSSQPLKPKPQIIKQLTSAYISERRAKGFSYFCDEPFTPAYSQTHKKLQIHVMELTNNFDSDDALQSGATPPISPSPKPWFLSVLW